MIVDRTVHGWTVALLLAGLVTSLGCKKPEVEVEEEGPPLPQPPSEASTNGPTPAQPVERAKLPVAAEQTCKMLDAHLRYAGIQFEKRECGEPHRDGGSLRQDRYTPVLPDKGPQPFSACLWPKEEGEGWEVGTIDRTITKCVERDRYCKQGQPAADIALSYRACPGDRDHVLLSAESTLSQIEGSWVATAEGGTRRLVIGAKGKITLSHDDKELFTGDLVLESATKGEVKSEGGIGRSVWMARVGPDLYFARLPITPAVDAKSFRHWVSRREWIRRFRGACYGITDKPPEVPKPIPCPIVGDGDGARVEVKTKSGRPITLTRAGTYWLEGAAGNWRYERAKKADEAAKQDGRK